MQCITRNPNPIQRDTAQTHTHKHTLEDVHIDQCASKQISHTWHRLGCFKVTLIIRTPLQLTREQSRAVEKNHFGTTENLYFIRPAGMSMSYKHRLEFTGQTCHRRLFRAVIAVLDLTVNTGYIRGVFKSDPRLLQDREHTDPSCVLFGTAVPGMAA